MASHFPEAWLEELRARSDIVQVISGYVSLTKKGRNYWGLCPFHGEKTASFSVDEEHQLYYCFGCKAGGNVINFVMDMDRLTFPEAVERLAERAHMTMPEMEQDEEYRERQTRKERLLAANREAARFYHSLLRGDAGKSARAYLEKRRISAQTATRFGLGQKTGLELSEKAGVMAGPEYTHSMGGTWYDGSTLPASIGQESSQFTPIQLANYIATLVNGGTRNATHLLKEIKSSDYSQILSSYEPRVLSTIEIQPQNLQAVKAGMLELTTTGSVASAFRKLDIQAGAKTGSAQVSAQTESNAVFVCFAPYDDPEIALAVVVEHGGSGSAACAPIAGRVLQVCVDAMDREAKN